MEYSPRVYDLSLHTVGLIVGSLLLAVHVIALILPEQTKGWLVKLPRSKPLGIGILAVDSLWSFWLVSNMDLGEFSQYRTWLQIGVPIAFVLTMTFVDEFLAVRALGMLALLAAEPVLSAAFLRPEVSRLLLVILAYVWLTLGLFWVGMPYVLRDQINWLTKTGSRFRALTLAGLVYGLVVLVCAVAVY
ncbi:MAG: hypothetical protein JO334_04790 [Verrucomicrobia bacterium]|nr:hypothetical protein [Verrucomicrobiota bacterium]